MSKLTELGIFTDMPFLLGFTVQRFYAANGKDSGKVQINIYAEQNFSCKHSPNVGFLRPKDLAQ